MPKVLIKEYDNSTTGFPTSDNFAVLVPGYFGTPAKDEEGEYYNPADVLIDYDVYELKSQAEFIKYIGKRGGAEISEGRSPELVEINPTGTNVFDKCHRNLRIADFNEENRLVYEFTELAENDADFGKDGYLLKTFTWFQNTEEENEDGSTIIVAREQKTTIRLTKVTANDVNFIKDEATNTWITESTDFCVIEVGNEGANANNVSHAQIGNQIAYELLGLGYTVLFKKISETETLAQQLANPTFWAPLKDKSVFNFRYVMTGGYYNVEAMKQIIDLATFHNANASLERSETLLDTSNGRGDCIALCDLDEDSYGISSNSNIELMATNMGTAAGAISNSNEYTAIFAPRVTYALSADSVKEFNYNKVFPASFHYLACAAQAFKKYSEWYAVAGYARGISSYDIENTSVKIGEIVINTLAPRVTNKYTTKSINLILHERGSYYLWGNRTAYALDNKGIKFHHFLNIRQLCTTIKKQLYTACRQFTFDPNSDLLWINFVNAIRPTLDAMKADQGIKGYSIVQGISDKKAVLTANIRIIPIEAVEDFDISIYLEESLAGINVSATESAA